MSTEEAVRLTLERHAAAVSCGCGGSVHVEHEIDDLFMDSATAQIGASYWLGEDA